MATPPKDPTLTKALVLSALGLIAIGLIGFTTQQFISNGGHMSPSIPKPLVYESPLVYGGQVDSFMWSELKSWYKYPLRSDGTDLTHLRPMIWDILSDGILTTPEWEKAVGAKHLEVQIHDAIREAINRLEKK